MDAVRNGTPVFNRQVQRDPQRHPAGALQSLVAGEVRPRGGHVPSRRDAQRRRVGEGARQRGIALLSRRRGNGPPDQVFRVVLEDADRLTASIARDFTADGRGSVLRHLCGAHGGGVRERHVAIESVHKDRIVWCHRIDPVVGRQWRPRPQRVVPVAAENPLARLQVRGVGFDAVHELLRRRGVAQIDPRELEAAVDEVRVSIGESRHHQPTARVQDFGVRADIPRDLGRIADREDLAVADRDRTRLACSCREAGPDEAIRDDDVSFGAAGRNEREEDQGA